MSTWRGRRLLVTGGAVFIGSAFVRQRLAAEPELRVTVLDKLTYAGSRENLAGVEGDPRLSFVEGTFATQKPSTGWLETSTPS